MVTNYLSLNKIEDTKGFLILAHNCDGELQMLLVHQEVFFKNLNYLFMNALFCGANISGHQAAEHKGNKRHMVKIVAHLYLD